LTRRAIPLAFVTGTSQNGEMIRSAFFGLLGAGLLLACAAPATSEAGDLIPGVTGGSAGQSQGGDSGTEGGATGTAGSSSPGEAGAGGGETAGQGDGGGPQPVGGSGGSGAGGSSAGSGSPGGSGGSGGSVTSKEPCCVAHDGPGCNDAAIQACVCEQDPTCCSGSWNQFCVNEIKQFGCGSCGGSAGGGGGGAGGSSTAGSGGNAFGGSAGGGAAPTFGGWCCNDKTTSPGCDIPEVVSCVCAEDPFCCDEWDKLCSAQVTKFGCAVCEGGHTCTDYPEQCVDCCISGHLSGYDSFGDDVAECACNGACKQACLSACQGGNVSSGCADCLNKNLGTACPMPACNANPDCAAYLSCANPCP